MASSRTYILCVLLAASLPLAARAEATATQPSDEISGVTSQPAGEGSASLPPGFDGSRLYRLGCKQILNGDFRMAFTTLRQALDATGSLPNIQRVNAWLTTWEDLADLRDEIHTKEYASYVRKANEAADAGDWPKAMDSITSAFWTTRDEEAFRKEEWLKELSAKAFSHGEDLRKRGEWSDATRIYSELALIFPDEPIYKERRDRCGAHAILEATYAEDPDWKTRTEGVSPAMAHDALWRIDRFYYVEPNLKKMAVSGLDRLVILAETTGLFKTFESLTDESKRGRFIGQLRGEMARVEAADKADFDIAQLIRTFDYAVSTNAKTVQLPRGVIVAEFINGAFDSLDRFSSMIWPAELAEFRKHTTGEFSGVGIQIQMEKDRITVFSPLEDTPAYEAGIEPGDTITQIDGDPVKGITLEQAVRRITGEAGTTVTLTIERQGVKEPFDVALKRDKIKVPSVKGWSRDEGQGWNYLIDQKMRIGYVRVTSFTETTTEHLRQVLKQLDEEDARGLILDLRYNPGGLLKTAVEMVSLFLPPGQPVVSTRGRASEPWSIPSGSDISYGDLPLIILINEYSASASEIVAGALHAHGRALLVGERTWGKGSVQNPWPLGSGEALLKLTTALYYLPFMEDRSIHREEESKEWGVPPDVEVKLSPREARRVLELRRESDVLRGKSGQAPATRPALSTRPAEDEEEDFALQLTVDPQVETALLLMRVRLVSNEPWSLRMASATVEAGKPSQALTPADASAR